MCRTVGARRACSVWQVCSTIGAQQAGPGRTKQDQAGPGRTRQDQVCGRLAGEQRTAGAWQKLCTVGAWQACKTVGARQACK